MKPTKPILTPELRDRVERKVLACLAIAREKYPGHEFEVPEIRYDVKNTDGGLAYGVQWLIRLNLILCFENEAHFIDTTVPHEVAHLVQRRVYGAVRRNPDGSVMLDPVTKRPKKVRSHGPEWAEVMGHFGLPATRCHSYSVASIARRPKRPRGGKVSGADLANLMRRLEGGVKRLPSADALQFASWIHALVHERTEPT